ncbi:hypothetical protein SEA_BRUTONGASTER_10 [Gordonia phage BrutonGaster]|uniref:Uncharacterized protein n=1 Tax=Gordonia phage BrutonGaster TaxID=2530116 RepID=A0A482JKD2_9CAUD|nr:hypothetical protein HOV26_gp010 [Gordonia phage BrutonGaster]QBP33232.1 hypothetical protein SEA_BRUTONGASTER_10 [Gordonia phage BrutonGaster]
MSYTIKDINEYVQDYDSPTDGSWRDFEELIQADSAPVQNPKPEEIKEGEWVDDEGWLHEPKRDGRNWSFRALRPQGYTGLKIPGIGLATLEESHGGFEGAGESMWMVFKIADDEGNVRYFRREGWYASYDGGHYDGPTVEVRPAEKVVTVFEAI